MNKQEIEKAIQLLKVEKANVTFNTDSRIPLYELAISALQQQLTNGWILCKDALPIARQHESGEPIEYNIMLHGGTVATTGCINSEGVWGWMDWNDYSFNPIGVDVIAWHPLPEPYKEVSHE